MCRLKSGIILKDRIFIPDYDSHTEMLEELNISDTQENAERLFVRAELIPKNGDVFTDIEEWTFNVDQDIVPEWFVSEYERQRMIEAVKTWAKYRIFVNVNDLEIKDGRAFYLKNCKNVVCKNSSVEARGNSSVEAWENSSVEAWENSSVVARENSSVVARENSSVVAWGNSSVVAWGNSSVVAWGNSSVEARGNSSVEARGNSSVVARENSSVEARENSSVVAWGNSSVEARGNSSVVARENSSVEAWENSSVVAWGNSSVVAWGNSVILKSNFSSFNTERLILSENSTFKDCVTRTIYQSGNFKLVSVIDGKINREVN